MCPQNFHLYVYLRKKKVNSSWQTGENFEDVRYMYTKKSDSNSFFRFILFIKVYIINMSAENWPIYLYRHSLYTAYMQVGIYIMDLSYNNIIYIHNY